MQTWCRRRGKRLPLPLWTWTIDCLWGRRANQAMQRPPCPAQEWRDVMAQWEAKQEMLAEAFDCFTVMERASPTVSGQFPPAPVPPVVADDTATTTATPRTEPDAAEAPGWPPSGSRRRLHVERFKAKVDDWTAFTRRF
ncbi:unnamed protein product [Lampetra fluviatilis]